MYSDEAINNAVAWSCGTPRFVSSQLWSSVISLQLPGNMDENDHSKWASIWEKSGEAVADFVANNCPNAIRSMPARNRYYELNELHEKFPVSHHTNRVDSFVCVASSVL